MVRICRYGLIEEFYDVYPKYKTICDLVNKWIVLTLIWTWSTSYCNDSWRIYVIKMWPTIDSKNSWVYFYWLNWSISQKVFFSNNKFSLSLASPIVSCFTSSEAATCEQRKKPRTKVNFRRTTQTLNFVNYWFLSLSILLTQLLSFAFFSFFQHIFCIHFKLRKMFYFFKRIVFVMFFFLFKKPTNERWKLIHVTTKSILIQLSNYLNWITLNDTAVRYFSLKCKFHTECVLFFFKSL